MGGSNRTMTRTELLAAEIYGYSFYNYEDHLGIGNVRYDRLMPESAEVLERAVREAWLVSKVAAELETSEESAQDLVEGCQRALAVIDAENPAESFRTAVRFTVRDAVADGLSSEDEIEKLITQICYRAADLAYLLKLRGEPLSRYSRHLRREPDVQYNEGYFDEDDA